MGGEWERCQVPWQIILLYLQIVHGHVRRFPIKELPKKEEELKQWLYNVFKEKDALLAHFKEKKYFPEGQNGSHELKAPVVCVHQFEYSFAC